MASDDLQKVSQKWGFGMAPIKAATQSRRLRSAEIVLSFIRDKTPDEETPQHLSEVKGWFSRILKQDQWDWFTVFEQLGRPGKKRSRDISNEITNVRNSVVAKSETPLLESLERLQNTNVERYLQIYFSGEYETKTDPDAGQIYILSTRELPNFLKIGYTTRSVTDRVREINSATGVMIPFGVRAIWRVKDAPNMERKIHEALSEYRVRSDREFFQIKYGTAFPLILNLIKRTNTEEL
jgi:hypothetical protein